MDALTPNTSAFLNYFAQQQPGDQSFDDGTAVKLEPTSLPPSAFFSLSGPAVAGSSGNTPESLRNTASASPDHALAPVTSRGGSGEASGSRRGSTVHHDASAGHHKRKAGHNHTVEQVSDEEDDSEDDEQSGHEDKRAHGNKANAAASGSGRRGGRKSLGAGVGDDDTPTKGGKDTKAARRKEQNRAAQKAFRERREAKVKTLEDKVAELEQKSYSAVAENENLRGLLKRLQEENVALKQSAFTFSMPVGGTPAAAAAAAVPAGVRTGSSTPRSNVPAYGARSAVKPPTPPHSHTDDSLKSVDEIRSPHLQHRGSSGMSAQVDTPESLASMMSSSENGSRSGSEAPKQPPMFDPAETFNAFALGVRPEWEQMNQIHRQTSGSSSDMGTAAPQSAATGPTANNFADAMSLMSGNNSTGLSPLSSSNSNNKSDIEALWASFYPQGKPTGSASAGASPAQASKQQTQQSMPFVGPSSGPEINPFNLFMSGGAGAAGPSSSTGFTPFINANNNINPMDRMAFRDTAAPAPAPAPAPAAPSVTGTAAVASPPSFDWSAFNADGIDSFLSSLNGQDANNADANDGLGDDEFSAQIQALINANQSTSAGVTGPAGTVLGNTNTMFSPTNYLNMSPSPLASGSSSGPSPAGSNNLSVGTGSASASNYASPDSMASSHASTAATTNCDHLEERMEHARALAMKPADIAGLPKTAAEIVHVVGPDGKIIKPSELWLRMGMQHQTDVDHLLIDDLCENMKAKATCKDGTNYLNIDDAEKMFKYGSKGA